MLEQSTPVSHTGLRQFDDLPAAEAVVKAWITPGLKPDFHKRQQRAVRRILPVLARALDRLAEEHRKEGL